jgi:signal transduction histidine kinase
VEKALIHAKEEAKRASKFKDRFLSTISHELRTPPNAVMGFSDLLADKRYGELSERQQRYVSHINQRFYMSGNSTYRALGDFYQKHPRTDSRREARTMCGSGQLEHHLVCLLETHFLIERASRGACVG